MQSLLRRIDSDIARLGGKRSKSRERIIEAFFGAAGHVTVEDLTRAVREKHRGIGGATVYRTLKLLARLGYARELDFGEGARRYESSLAAHHDHLVCVECGVVLEFEQRQIEALQEQVARRHGFLAARHRLEIFGTCRACRTRARGGRR